MPVIRHINLSDFTPFCLSGSIVSWDGETGDKGAQAHQIDVSSAREFVVECDSIQTANRLNRRYPGARHCALRDLNEAFEQLSCPLGLAGAPNLIIFVQGLHKRGWPTPPLEQGRSLRDWQSWLRTNCRGDVCILSGNYQRRLSFADEEDYILAKMSFA